MSVEYLKNAKTIFWDFDGVIKDSVVVKSDAFEQLFLPFGDKVAISAREHHEANGGMSRFEKLPIYLNWAGEEVNAELIDEYATKFSQLAKQKVINSEWVDGISDYLERNYNRQYFFLITSTPQHEIEDIIDKLNISRYFKRIIGSPTTKKDAIKNIIVNYSIKPEESIMVGDSVSDYEAAVLNQTAFVLRKTNLNQDLQKKLSCLMISNYK
jgi:HAD superfamily hydrolase (TIGR01549 family)